MEVWVFVVLSRRRLSDFISRRTPGLGSGAMNSAGVPGRKRRMWFSRSRALSWELSFSEVGTDKVVDHSMTSCMVSLWVRSRNNMAGVER